MLNVKLEVFEGPFDLLFKLIEKHKIDIYDIPMALICKEFVEEVEKLQETNIDNIGEFLIMAATLLKIKSKMLLPDDEEGELEEDPRLELVAKLLEYKKFKEVCSTLREMEEESSQIAFKGNTALFEEMKGMIDYDSFLEGVNMDTLTQAFLNILKSEKKQKDAPDEKDTAKNITDTVRRKRVFTVEMQMASIYDKLIVFDEIKFEDLFGEEQDKMEKIMTFCALLEMMKMKKIKAVQEETFGEIIISKADDFETGIDYNIDINVDKVEEDKPAEEEQTEENVEENKEETIDETNMEVSDVKLEEDGANDNE